MTREEISSTLAQMGDIEGATFLVEISSLVSTQHVDRVQERLAAAEEMLSSWPGAHVSARAAVFVDVLRDLETDAFIAACKRAAAGPRAPFPADVRAEALRLPLAEGE